MLVIVAPGQGAQTPGFLAPWLDAGPARGLLHWWSAVSGVDLVRYGTAAGMEEIRDTAVAQPLLVAAGLLAARVLFPEGSGPGAAHRVAGAVSGHSIGELTAAAVAGVFPAESALALARERGRAMAAAATAEPTGMTAVLGGEAGAVSAAIAGHGLRVATVNGAGQVVAAGTEQGLRALRERPPDGARVHPLSVAGAFHTHHMAPAAGSLARLIPGLAVTDPRTRFISNADGAVVHDAHELLHRLVTQVTGPVRWDLCMATMGELGATAVIELPPAGTLSALIRRALPSAETVALKTPDDLVRARELVERHGGPNPLGDSPAWRLVVTPFAGTVRMGDVPVGTTLAAGASIGAVVSPREYRPITAPHGGTVLEWLVEDGDPVAPGQPVVRLHPRELGEVAA
jgi:[acyl-carrier-protein] S-malonyltransferase